MTGPALWRYAKLVNLAYLQPGIQSAILIRLLLLLLLLLLVVVEVVVVVYYLC